MKFRFLSLFIFFTSCSDSNRVDQYLQAHPQTLLKTAESMKRGVLIRGMLPEEVQAILGEPTGITTKSSLGIKSMTISYLSNCQYDNGNKIVILKGPVAIQFVQENQNNEKVWLLSSIRSIWR